MKNLLIILLFASCTTTAQNSDKQTFVVAGANLGYFHSVTGAIQLGVRSHNVFISANSITTVTFKATTPHIAAFNLGYNIGSFQPFVSYGYHTIGREAEAKFRGTPDEFINGWYPGYGMAFYFKNIPLSLTAQRQGKETNFSIGTYITP